MIRAVIRLFSEHSFIPLTTTAIDRSRTSSHRLGSSVSDKPVMSRVSSLWCTLQRRLGTTIPTLAVAAPAAVAEAPLAVVAELAVVVALNGTMGCLQWMLRFSCCNLRPPPPPQPCEGAWVGHCGRVRGPGQV